MLRGPEAVVQAVAQVARWHLSTVIAEDTEDVAVVRDEHDAWLAATAFLQANSIGDLTATLHSKCVDVRTAGLCAADSSDDDVIRRCHDDLGRRKMHDLEAGISHQLAQAVDLSRRTTAGMLLL